jgi:hypothetical protein
MNPITFITTYTDFYQNNNLAELLNEIEIKGNITNEEVFFKNLVNPSGSKEHPYHRWVRYREGYSGELVKELIRRSKVTNKQYVFDPMSGSGSSLIAAMELGYSTVGCDVIPYSVDLSNAKLQYYSKKSLKIIEDFVKRPLKEYPDNNEFIELDNGLFAAKKYFKADNFHQIVTLKRDILEITDVVAKELLWAAWLAIIEDCSERKKDGNGLATRPSKISDVYQRFNSQVELMLDDIAKYPFDSNLRGKVYLNSASKTKDVLTSFEKETQLQLGAIIFSPPYANSFDYFESYKLELLCGYYDPKSLIHQRQNAIRNYRKGYGYQLSSKSEIVNMLCDEVRRKIPEKEKMSGTTDNRSRLVPNLLVGYFDDMSTVLKEFYDVMPQGTQCHIVVDQSSYLGVIIPTDLVLADIGVKHGFKLTNIIRCRRANTSGQQLKQYPYLKEVLRESIVTLEKA